MAHREVFYPLLQQTLEVQALPENIFPPKMAEVMAGLQDHAAERASSRKEDFGLCSWHPPLFSEQLSSGHLYLDQ